MDTLNNESHKTSIIHKNLSLYEKNYITDLNNNKKYIILSTSIIQHIINSNNITRKSASVWLSLYSLTSVKSNYSVTIPMSQIADITGMSKRSICRAVAELRDKGYLNIRCMAIKSSFWPVNNYTLTVPEHVFNEINIKSKNRNKGNCEACDNNKEGADYMHPIMNNLSTERITASEDEKTKHLDEKNLIKTKIGTLYNNKYYLYTQYTDCEFFNKNMINKFELEIGAHQKLLDSLKNELSQQQKMFDSEPNSSSSPEKKFGLLKKCSNIQSNIDQIEGRISYYQLQILKEKNKMVAINSVNNDPLFIFNQKRGRTVSAGLVWWARKKLFSFGIDKSCIPRLLNEIVYAVKMGALSKLKYSFNDMPIMKSFNIALKLVKENKWQTPVSFNNLESFV